MPRYWSFEKFVLHLDTYRFTENITKSLFSELSKGIYVNSTSIWDGGRYSIESTAKLENMFQVIAKVKSVKMLTMAIYSSDYTKYPFCRKNRLSGNIKKL